MVNKIVDVERLEELQEKVDVLFNQENLTLFEVSVVLGELVKHNEEEIEKRK